MKSMSALTVLALALGTVPNLAQTPTTKPSAEPQEELEILPRPACFDLGRFPEFRDGQPMVGNRLKPPLREITYAGPPKWMLRHSPETGRYYPVLLKPSMAVVVDKTGKVRYNPGESSRWVSLEACTEQELLQGLAYGVISRLPSTSEVKDTKLASRE